MNLRISVRWHRLFPLKLISNNHIYFPPKTEAFRNEGFFVSLQHDWTKRILWQPSAGFRQIQYLTHWNTFVLTLLVPLCRWALQCNRYNRHLLLFAGHLHHFVASESTGRQVFQVPAMDGGSQWYQATAGANAQAGLMTIVVGSNTPRGWDDLRIL